MAGGSLQPYQSHPSSPHPSAPFSPPSRVDMANARLMAGRLADDLGDFPPVNKESAKLKSAARGDNYSDVGVSGGNSKTCHMGIFRAVWWLYAQG